jgi:glutamyl-tRNA synthetase
MTGRFAPSPTGDLHVGNLRTALVAWLAARAEGAAFLLRMEDLDRVTSGPEHERSQLDDLAALGLHHDGEVIRQSERFHLYEEMIAQLTSAGLTYACYCTRREVREAAMAPHGAPLRYPGTCRNLSSAERLAREREGRPPALRLRSSSERVVVQDELAGRVEGVVDDVVLRRNDGVPAYHLAVVVDDALQGVSEVVRGDDLLPVTPTQVALQRLLGLPTPRYLHVPLVMGADGERLAKRHGAVTLRSLRANGVEASQVLGRLAASLNLAEADARPSADELVDRFERRKLPRLAWVVDSGTFLRVPSRMVDESGARDDR